eukprot:872770-Prorocentrum_minimum.AAC.4
MSAAAPGEAAANWRSAAARRCGDIFSMRWAVDTAATSAASTAASRASIVVMRHACCPEVRCATMRAACLIPSNTRDS